MVAETEAPVRVVYAGDADGLDEDLEAAAPVPLRVEHVETAAAALERLERGAVDAVVSEYDLPDTDGVTLLRTIRASHPDTPFVLFTDAGDEELASEAVAAGVDGYVPASRGPEAVVDRLREALPAGEPASNESERRYRQLLEASPAPINLFDASGDIIYGNDAVLDLLGFESRADLVGRSIFEFIADDDREAAAEELRTVVEEQVAVGPTTMGLVTEDGETRDVLVATAPGEYGGEPIGQAVVTDVSELEGVKRDLRTEREFVDSALDALDDVFFFLDAEGNVLRWNARLREVTGRSDAELAEATLADLLVDADVPKALGALQRVEEEGKDVVEIRVTTTEGGAIPMEARGRRLDDENGETLGIVGIARDVSERNARERDIERQREKLATLNRNNQVIRDVNASLVTAESRSEIEELVCEQFVTAGGYRFAWIGALERGHDCVVPRTWAGHEEGFLDTLTISLDGKASQGPAARAIRTGEAQTNAISDPVLEPWREEARLRGYESITAIPITYREATYGVLAVYAGAEDEFEGVDPEVLTELGRTIGTAINAVERKWALVSDPAIELELELEDGREFFSRFAAAVDARVELEKVTPRVDGSYDVYLTVDAGDANRVEDVCEQFRSVESWSQLVKRDGTCVFDLRVREELVVDLLATYGSTLGSLVANPSGCELEVELPAGTDVRSFVETLKEQYRNVDLRAQRERTETRQPHLGLRLEDVLTERQQEVLETAFFAGFYGEPREMTGVEIAEKLGISGPTFHHHLRTAERRLFSELFGAEDGT